ncbi:hypothetical protein JCGZ_06877 [Jatropha curcas]|uniref:Uncharacterized protein n=1 Tax=Jatropha curcas TaxID=180498 RepID=A0A067KZS0_JATCU|nr:hypothetical protein JCGZ_06877 [Jatropha curcas]
MPPSLSSVPSSSTPLPGPVESSPASQSPTAPASTEPCDKLSLVARQWIHIGCRTTRGKRLLLARVSEAFCMGRGYYDYAKSGMGEIPTPMEAFTYTYTKAHDGNTFVDRRAMGVNEHYSTARERAVSSQAESKAESRIDDSTLYASTAGSGPQPDHSAEEITALRARVDEQERQLAELRAHVMRMSGQHDAGTSCSDPPPATDRDVYTALHQPLPSPLDPDIANYTLVTPVDTATHPTDTPPGTTTQDRADDQPRRFDFGPF